MKGSAREDWRNNLSETTVAIDCRLGSGIETILRNVVPRIASRLKRIILLGPRDLKSRWGIGAPNIETVEYDARVYRASEQYRFPWRIAAKADLLHVPHYNVPLLWPRALVVTLNDLTQFTPEFGSGALQRMIARFLIRWSLWRANQALTLSEHAQADFVKTFGGRASRLIVAYPGVNQTIFHPVDKECARRGVAKVLGIDQPYLLTIGSVRPHKNLTGLIRAFDEARNRFGIRHLLVVGGERKGFLTQTKIEVPGHLQNDVLFTGRIADELLPTLYSGCEAFVFPSFYEGFGIPPLEAMACDVPTICSNRGSLPEVVGDASVLVDPADPTSIANAIHEVLTNEARRVELVRAGRQRVEKFNWENTAERYLHAYRLAIA